MSQLQQDVFLKVLAIGWSNGCTWMCLVACRYPKQHRLQPPSPGHAGGLAALGLPTSPEGGPGGCARAQTPLRAAGPLRPLELGGACLRSLRIRPAAPCRFRPLRPCQRRARTRTKQHTWAIGVGSNSARPCAGMPRRPATLI